MKLKRIGILTGGGDCSGINAVIRAVTRAAIFQHQATVIGLEDGYDGLIYNRHQDLTLDAVKDILGALVPKLDRHRNTVAHLSCYR